MRLGMRVFSGDGLKLGQWPNFDLKYFKRVQNRHGDSVAQVVFFEIFAGDSCYRTARCCSIRGSNATFRYAGQITLRGDID